VAVAVAVVVELLVHLLADLQLLAVVLAVLRLLVAQAMLEQQAQPTLAAVAVAAAGTTLSVVALDNRVVLVVQGLSLSDT
jgi:hypothetical protein